MIITQQHQVKCMKEDGEPVYVHTITVDSINDAYSQEEKLK